MTTAPATRLSRIVAAAAIIGDDQYTAYLTPGMAPYVAMSPRTRAAGMDAAHAQAVELLRTLHDAGFRLHAEPAHIVPSRGTHYHISIVVWVGLL